MNKNKFDVFRESGAPGLLVVVLVSYFFSPLAAVATEVKNLYQAKAEVLSLSKEHRNNAIKSALQQVLSKLTSAEERADANRIENTLADATQYVRQYRYESGSSTSTAKTDKRPRWLIVDFDPVALKDGLKSEGFTVWESDRPDTLLWLRVDAKRNRAVISTESLSKFKPQIEEAARKKGLPIMFPLMDLTDRLSLNTDEFWIDESLVRQSSERYGAGQILVVRAVQKTSKKWETEWKLFLKENVYRWAKADSSFSQAFRAGMENVFEELVSAYAFSGRQAVFEGLTLKISGIRSRGDVQRVTEYLKSLSSARTVKWLSIEANSVLFRLRLKDKDLSLEQILASENQFERILSEQETDILHYKLAP